MNVSTGCWTPEIGTSWSALPWTTSNGRLCALATIRLVLPGEAPSGPSPRGGAGGGPRGVVGGGAGPVGVAGRDPCRVVAGRRRGVWPERVGGWADVDRRAREAVGHQ